MVYMRLFPFFLLISISFQGCLTFHRISYKIKLEDELKGKGTIEIYDIRSDAETDGEFEDDKNSLFDYMLKSEEFIFDMRNEGKEVTSRRLYAEDNMLHAEVNFNFKDVKKVEGIEYDGSFYFLTMEHGDSINFTNGEVIISKDYKRILWDKNVETIEFEIIASDYDNGSYRKLAPFYEE
jgi:hypothetical protein